MFTQTGLTMKNLRLSRTIGLMTLGALLCLHTQSFGQTEYRKLAQTGMKFLALSAGAQQAALGDAFTAATGNASSMFYNTAGMAFTQQFADVWMGHTQWIADIKHYHAAVLIRPFNGLYGVLGFSYQYVDYGEVQSTILATNSQGYLDVGIIKPNAYAFGISYAKALSDRFAVGANVKFVGQNLGTGMLGGTYGVNGTTGEPDSFTPERTREFSIKDIPTFDFGILYKTGLKSLTFGMTVRNFAREVSYVEENFQMPLTFRIGIAMNVFDLLEFDPEFQRLQVTADAEHPRDFSEQYKVGLEYVFANTIALRVGYVSPADEYDLSYGLGLQTSLAGTSLAVDYAYTPFGVFDPVNRFSVRFGL